MKVLKCHKCRYVWLYTGQSATHCICPASPCRTTVRFTRQEVPIRWDLTPAAVPTLPPTDLGGVAYPFIDVYDRAASIGIQVYSDDGLNTRTLYIPPDLQEDQRFPTPPCMPLCWPRVAIWWSRDATRSPRPFWRRSGPRSRREGGRRPPCTSAAAASPSP